MPGPARSPAGLLRCPSREPWLASLRSCQGQSGVCRAVPAKQQRKQVHRTAPKKGSHRRRSPGIPAKIEQEGGSPPTARKKAAEFEFQKPARISHTWVPLAHSGGKSKSRPGRPAKGRAEPRWAGDVLAESSGWPSRPASRCRNPGGAWDGHAWQRGDQPPSTAWPALGPEPSPPHPRGLSRPAGSLALLPKDPVLWVSNPLPPFM